MEKLRLLVRRLPIVLLLRIAIACTLLSLTVMALITLFPGALTIVIGMGISHGLGVAGVVLFGVTILKEVLEAIEK